MVHKLALFIAVVTCLEIPALSSPQYYRYGLPAPLAPFAAPPAPLAPFPTPAVAASPALQEDSIALELLPPLQHVVGTKYPAVSPGKGYRFPLSQLLNPTPPPNLKH